MEPLGRIELPTFPLPMGCYTPKPQWQCPGHQRARFNHCGLTCVSATDSRDWYHSPGRLPRSHSLVLRKTGNLVGFSLGSSNLPLGATHPPLPIPAQMGRHGASLMRCLDSALAWMRVELHLQPVPLRAESRLA